MNDSMFPYLGNWCLYTNLLNELFSHFTHFIVEQISIFNKSLE